MSITDNDSIYNRNIPGCLEDQTRAAAPESLNAGPHTRVCVYLVAVDSLDLEIQPCPPASSVLCSCDCPRDLTVSRASMDSEREPKGRAIDKGFVLKPCEMSS